jgi:hypothetical protein
MVRRREISWLISSPASDRHDIRVISELVRVQTSFCCELESFKKGTTFDFRVSMIYLQLAKKTRSRIVEPTDLLPPSIAVKMSLLNKCTQKSVSSANAKFRRIPQPSTLVSKFESVRVCSSRILTICSLNNSFLVLWDSMRFVIARAAEDLVLTSALCRSLMTGRICLSRSAASSGSLGGLTARAVGLLRYFSRYLDFDFPILVRRIVFCVRCWWDVSIYFCQELFIFQRIDRQFSDSGG